MSATRAPQYAERRPSVGAGAPALAAILKRSNTKESDSQQGSARGNGKAAGRHMSGLALQMSKLRTAIGEDFSAEILNFRTLLSKQVAEEVHSLRSWIDLEVVRRIVHVDRTLTSLQMHLTGNQSNGHISPVSPGKQSNGSTYDYPSAGTLHHRDLSRSQQDWDSRIDSKSLQMPNGDGAIDMDYDVQLIKSDASFGLVSPGPDFPMPAPPPAHKQDLLPLWTVNESGVQKDDGSEINIVQPSKLQEPNPAENTVQSEEWTRSGSGHRSSMTSQERLMKKMISQKNRSYCMAEAWAFLDDPESSNAAKMYLNTMIVFTLIAVATSIAQSLFNESLSGTWAFFVESVFEIVFLAEFLLRLIACPDRLLFACNMHNMFDLAAGLPFAIRVHVYLHPVQEESTSSEILSNALIGVVPMLRVLKTVREFKQFQLLLSALSLVREALPICLFALMALTLSFAAMMFMVEPRSNIYSYPHSMWFVIVTMTTLGYGDVSPSTTAGYLIASSMVVSSVMFMAMPLGIIGHAFTTVWEERDRILLVHGVRTRLRMWGYRPEDIPIMFDIADEDCSGDLDFSEFKQMMEDLRMGLADMRIVELFKSIDTDGEGTIDAREFIQALFPQLLAEEWMNTKLGFD